MPDRLAPAVTALLLLAGCAAQPVDTASPDALGYIDSPLPLDNADWSNPTEVEMRLSSYAFSPAQLSIQPDKAYSLTLVNVSEDTHTFTSEAFFKAIVVRELVSSKRLLERPKLRSIGLDAGETKVLEFVAVRPGTYELACNMPFHYAAGMKGTLVVEER